MKIKLILAGLVLCLSTQSQAIGDVEKGTHIIETIITAVTDNA